jgi:hypothetical protein
MELNNKTTILPINIISIFFGLVTAVIIIPIKIKKNVIKKIIDKT